MRTREALRVAAAATFALSAAALATTDGSTYAAYSDLGAAHGKAQADIWAPDPPAECGDISKYGTPPHRLDAVIWGTFGDDTIYAPSKGNHPHIIMGLRGDDVIIGGNSGDCLVGGYGNDRLTGGNAKDILLGGPGDDFLDGGRAKDKLNGQDDRDVCDGGLGNDELVNCTVELTVLEAPKQIEREEKPAPAEDKEPVDDSAPGGSTGTDDGKDGQPPPTEEPQPPAPVGQEEPETGGGGEPPTAPDESPAAQEPEVSTEPETPPESPSATPTDPPAEGEQP